MFEFLVELSSEGLQMYEYDVCKCIPIYIQIFIQLINCQMTVHVMFLSSLALPLIFANHLSI